MTEIEKLYELAGVEKKIMCDWTCKDAPNCNACCEHYGNRQKHYPPFTVEKQLELIKWLMKYDEIHADFNDNMYGFATLNYSGKYKKDFSNALANVITNELWQVLTETEQEEIKSILEE